ncbi:hypothetical protein ACFC26_09615 [Kitasatospora purpeofusca]|uniref:hypothetical protein n=1 Tax=Kitasatospora purpeofusca TaxID=67352 RepID=UPI0035DD8C8A
MSNFKPLTAAHVPNFFDANGNPLGPSSKCPTCNRTTRFDLHLSNGQVMQFRGTCGHDFELPTPAK